jgi:hypothetical protein
LTGKSFQSGISKTTAPSNQTIKHINTALKRHLENKSKERSFDSGRQMSSGLSNPGLPPRDQNLVTRSINIEKRHDITQNSQEFQPKTMSKQFSKNQLAMLAQNEENSRNRLGNRKSIPANFRGEEIEAFQAPQNTMQIVRNQYDRDITPRNSGEMRTTSHAQGQPPLLKKAESDKTKFKPPMNGFTTNLQVKNGRNPFGGLARNMSMGKLKNGSLNTQIFQNRKGSIKTGKQSVADLMAKLPGSIATTTPKNHDFTAFAEANRTSCSRRSSIGAKFDGMKHNNGSVTNRTQVNPLNYEEEPIQNTKIMLRMNSGANISINSQDFKQRHMVSTAQNFSQNRQLQN